MGKLHVNSGIIQQFNVSLHQETYSDGGNFNVVHLEVLSESVHVKYRVCADTRNPDINIIKNDLESGLNQAASSSFSFEISEYLERNYIFVTYPNGTIIQYTASRISI